MRQEIPASIFALLPKASQITPVPALFDDSTHDVWHLQNPNESCFLKVVRNTETPFWQIMQHLFGFDLRKSVAHFDVTYDRIRDLSPLSVPALKLAQYHPHDKAFSLTLSEAGKKIIRPDDEMIAQLATHLARLHSTHYAQWGTLIKPGFDTQDWRHRLENTLKHFSQIQNVPKQIYQSAISSCSAINTSTFVIQMPDLRWDQFLQQDDQLSALIDLDAFIIAPRELDFTVVETILTQAQHEVFMNTYTQFHPPPVVEPPREAYRLLLYLMQTQGKQNIGKWMATKPFNHA